MMLVRQKPVAVTSFLVSLAIFPTCVQSFFRVAVHANMVCFCERAQAISMRLIQPYSSTEKCRWSLYATRIRERREVDVEQIQSLLLLDAQQSDFDPEGPLEVDCGNAAAIKESYSSDDGGCFLVATDDRNDSKILATAALSIGTQIAYLKSGASISTPEVNTGAVRRVCTVGDESIIYSLLKEVECRALQSGASELIILAYPPTRRPSATLLEGMEYRKLPAKLPRVDAIQYGKALENNTPNTTIIYTSMSRSSSTFGDVTVGAFFITGLLIAFGCIAYLMGLEIVPSDDNRGIGAPLSIQELERLEQDEQLKRTNLDGDGQQQTRQWEVLSNEERREEAALMRIIQGQDIRLQ